MTPIDIPFIDAAMPDAERCQEARRASDGHTPETCFKLLDVQETMDLIFRQLADGKERMDCIEVKLDANTKATQANADGNAKILEIVQMGEGFFKGVKATGKWARKIIMFFAPPITAAIALWYSIKPTK